MNNTITEIESTLEETNSRISEAEEQISEMRDRMVGITAEEQNKGKRMKRTEYSLRDLWNNIKHSNNQVIGVLEEEGKNERHWEIDEEIIVENFPNVGKKIVS